MKYFESKLAGYIGVAIMVLGVVAQVLPILSPFVPAKEQPLAAEIITFVGGLKAWLALNPWKAGA